jgi:hypothetical protein
MDLVNCAVLSFSGVSAQSTSPRLQGIVFFLVGKNEKHVKEMKTMFFVTLPSHT